MSWRHEESASACAAAVLRDLSSLYDQRPRARNGFRAALGSGVPWLAGLYWLAEPFWTCQVSLPGTRAGSTTLIRSISETAMSKALLGLAIAVVMASASAAHAVSERVKRACQADYYAFCGEHAVDSPSLRFCMRRAQARLSAPCVKELARSKEVTQADIKRYKARKRQ